MKATAVMPWATIDFEADDLDDAMNRSIKFLLPHDDHLTLNYDGEVWDYDVQQQKWTPDLDNDYE
jgi:hypothetical protein